MRMVILLAAIAAVSTPVLAAEKKAKSNDPNEMICRRDNNVTGSRLGSKRTCMTQAQWDQIARDQRMAVDKVQSFRPTNGG
jgi:hypothetical protein